MPELTRRMEDARKSAQSAPRIIMSALIRKIENFVPLMEAEKIALTDAPLNVRKLTAHQSVINEGAQSDGDRMRTHVEAIGQERHRVVGPAGSDFGHHHDGRDPHHELRAALAGGVALVEFVAVLPRAQVMGVHLMVFTAWV